LWHLWPSFLSHQYEAYRLHSPSVAGDKGGNTTHTLGPGIGQHSSHPTFATVGDAGEQISLTAIDVWIAVAKAAQGEQEEQKAGQRQWAGLCDKEQ
jgi:hypothetical protein